MRPVPVEALTCPKCRLVSPAGTETCDCGYSFVSGEVGAPRTPAVFVLSGVGGWLALLTYGLLVIGPVIGAGRILTDFAAAERETVDVTTLAEWTNFKGATWVGFFAIAAVSIFGGLGLLLGKDPSVVRRAMMTLWIIGPGGVVLLGMVVPIATLSSLEGFDRAALIQPFVTALIQSLAVAALWTAYLVKSKRVKATYGFQ